MIFFTEFNMMHEEAYKVQYLYNAVIEYLYFIIISIEVYGPQNLRGLAKYAKFFKTEFLSFIKIFKGENQVERISNLLCTATTAFYVREETVHLSESYNSFKKVIHENYIKSKVVDLVLRGISSVQDVYKNINLSNVINMQEDVFLDMLNHYPHFHVDTDSSVIVLQFHGLIGFDNNVYKTIAEYFESYLQKVDALTYDDINVHSRFIPSCGVQNALVVFCVFYISDVFKIKNNKVRIRKNWKVKPENQQRIDVDQLSSRCQDDVSVSRLVFIAHGPYLQNWTGEIIRLNKSIGFIQCVIDFKGNYQGVFSVYFNFAALKFVCDTENLENYLNIRDTVEFDAEFCDKTAMKDRYWKALQVTVTKQGLKRNKYKLKIDTEEYKESIQFKNKFNPSLKSYLENNQCLRSWSKDINGYNSEKSSCCTENISNIPLNFSSEITSLHPVQTLHNMESKPMEVFSDQVSTSSTVDKSNKPPLTQYIAHNDSNQPSNEMSPMKNKIFEKINAPLESDFKQHIQKLSKEILQNSEKGLHKNHVVIPNFLFSHSNFIFGEIVIITNNEGIAISLNPDQQCEVYFNSQAIIDQDAKYAPKKGNKVLLFIPHSDKESSLCVATLIYVLDNEESALVSENYEWVQDFVTDYFFPKLKSMYNLNTCDCDFSKGLFFENPPEAIPTKYSETAIKFYKFLIDLKENFKFDEKTVKLFRTVVKMICSHRLEMSEMKMFACVMSQLFKSVPCYRKFGISFASKRNESVLCKSSQRNSQLLPPHLIGKKVNSNRLHANSLPLKNKCLELHSSSSKKVKFENKNYSSLTLHRLKEYNKGMCDLKQDATESGRASCSSMSSYVSCYSKNSSDDQFHSCDSLSGKPTSISEVDFKSDPSLVDYQTDSTNDEIGLSREENASSPEIFSYFDATDKFAEIQVIDTHKKELSPQNYEDHVSYQTDSTCDESVLSREGNASSSEILSYSDTTDKFAEIQVIDTHKKELSPQNYEDHVSYQTDSTCDESVLSREGNAFSSEILSYSDTTDKFAEIQVIDTHKKELSPQNYEDHVSYQTDSTCDETVLSRQGNKSSPEIFSFSHTAHTFAGIQVNDTDKKELSPQDCKKVKIDNQDKKYLKLKCILFKRTNKKKRRVIVGLENTCSKCQKQLIETTACISTITNSCLLLSAINNEQNITLSFPKCLIPNEIWTSMKLNTILKIAIVPHALIQLYRILYIELSPK